MVFSVPRQAIRSWSSACPTLAAVARGAHPLQALHLAGVAGGVHLQQGDGEGLVFGVGVHAHDVPDAIIDLALVAVGGVGDLALEEALLDGGQHAAQLVDAAEVVVGLGFDAPGGGFEEVGAGQRVNRVGHARIPRR